MRKSGLDECSVERRKEHSRAAMERTTKVQDVVFAKPIGLARSNFQVMSQTHSSLLKEPDIDSRMRVEQMGHTVEVGVKFTRSRRSSTGRKR
jgi:hypothetical protein